MIKVKFDLCVHYDNIMVYTSEYNTTYIMKIELLKPTCACLGKESMFKNVPNPFLQFGVLSDFIIILVVVAEHFLHKPIRNVFCIIYSRL